MERFQPFGMGGVYKRYREADSSLLLERPEAFAFGSEMISRHELRVWFEPDWRIARRLAKRHPTCAIYSIPLESATSNLWKTPSWRLPRPNHAKI